MGRLKSVSEAFVTVAILAACGVLIWSNIARPQSRRRPEPPLPSAPIRIGGPASRGATTASVALVEFSDFQCPYCGAFSRELSPVLDDMFVAGGRVIRYFLNFPLAQIHPLATRAAEFAICSGKQGRFWDVHRLFFRSPLRLSEPDLRTAATDAGLSMPVLDQCLERDAARILADEAQLASSLGVSSTPTFFVGRLVGPDRIQLSKRIVGFQQQEVFVKAIEEALTSR